MIGRLLPIAVAAALLGFFCYCAPFEIASVTVWAGITLLLTGALCLIKPIRLLGLRTRRAASIAAACGLALFAIGLLWPAAERHTGAPFTFLDAALPSYHFEERHQVLVHASLARTTAAVREVTFDDLRVYNLLMRIRGLAQGRANAGQALGRMRVLEAMTRPGSGFSPLPGSEREIVMGMTGQPWAGRRGATGPDTVTVVFNLLVEDAGGGYSRVSTVTRIRANSDAARRTMARYWRVIYPGSGLLRRMWIQSARDRAER